MVDGASVTALAEAVAHMMIGTARKRSDASDNPALL